MLHLVEDLVEESVLPTLDGNHLSLDEIVAVARGGGQSRSTPAARERVAASHEFADTVAEERPIYGRSTGSAATVTRSCRIPTPRPCSCCARTPPARARSVRPSGFARCW